jgi:adenylate kinase
MKMLNEEFNYYRGLFPLKVFITGPPCSGKTHFASKLNELYGVPHIKISDIVDMGKNLTTEYGEVVRTRIEELKDIAE